MSTLRALCQDCLRAPTFETDADLQKAHEEITRCVCGGQLCGCDFCLEVLADLESGKREGISGIEGGPVGDWTASDGVKANAP